jgi:aryl-alcohol dehydrogenase-like predicted oxidoreductase
MDTERARRVVDLLDEIASGRAGASTAQAALNWVARRAGVSSIIVGARTSEQLADNLKASTWSLTDAEMARLDEVSALPPRYPYFMHRDFAGQRNPSPPLLPPIAAA